MNNDIRNDYSADSEALKTVSKAWDDRESLIIGSPVDRISQSQSSKVSDGSLSTMTMERSFRVMGQLGTGIVKASGKRDKGKALLMDIILQRHVIPNAKWGGDLLTKLRQLDFYSQVYGVMPMFYDWKVRGDGYVGPDARIIPMRDFTPQRGRTSIWDMDYVYIDTYHPVRDLERELDKEDSQWNKKALKEVIANAKAGEVDKDYDKLSSIERARQSTAGINGGKGDGARVRLVTKYWSGENGHWETFCPDFSGDLLRDIPNPHGTGRIPVVLKQSFPLIDSLYGLGDFERGESLQKAGDALTNLYFDAVKMSIFRPMIVNPNGVVPHTLKYQPGARWLETIPNSIRLFEGSPQGMDTFQGTIGYIKGALNNNFGTTDTMISTESASDPQFGKTPMALQMQQQRESSRDNWDRFFMEQAVEELFDGFVNLIAAKHETALDVSLFGEEIEQILGIYPEAKEMLEVSDSGASATLTIKGKDLKGADYRFHLDSGSTKAKDDKAQYEALKEMFSIFKGIPTLDQALAKQGSMVDYGMLFRIMLQSSSVEDTNKILKTIPQQSEGTGLGVQQSAPVNPKDRLDYKTAPADIRRQMEMDAGINPSTQEPVAPGQAPLVQAAMQAEQQQAQANQPAQTQPVIAHGQQFDDPEIGAAAMAMFGNSADMESHAIQMPAR